MTRMIGCVHGSLQGLMLKEGLLKTSFYTCPICKMAISTKLSSVRGHLAIHTRKNSKLETIEFPNGAFDCILDLLANRKGVNAKLANKPQEAVVFARDFVAKMKAKGEFFNPADRPIGTKVIMTK